MNNKKIHGNKGRKFTEEHRLKLSLVAKARGSNRTGAKQSEETKLKISIAKTGYVSPMKGKYHSEETKRKISEKGKGRPAWNKDKKLPQFSGSNHPLWKGSEVSYRNLHRWVERNLGKPEVCEICGKINLKGHSIHWANASGKYIRELTDWLRLCVLCHKIFDRNRFTLSLL